MRAVKASPDFVMTVTRRVATSVMETAVEVQEAFREAQRQAVRAEQLSVAAQSAPDVSTTSDEDVGPVVPSVSFPLRLVRAEDDLRLVRVEDDKTVVEYPGYGCDDNFCYVCFVGVGPDDEMWDDHRCDPKHVANWRSMEKFRHWCRKCDRVFEFPSFVGHHAKCRERFMRATLFY